MDGSGRGGGALSASSAANARVMFIGLGERLNNIEPFDSKKFIGGLLGIPDIEVADRARADRGKGGKPEARGNGGRGA